MNRVVQDVYSEQEFEDLLEAAEENAKSAWEQDFVTDMRDRYDIYNLRLFLTEKQEEALVELAGHN